VRSSYRSGCDLADASNTCHAINRTSLKIDA
jgi:hypothetical protein